MHIRAIPLVFLGTLACSPPAPPEPAPPPEPATVEISQPRELRGAWIATVANIDWPSRPGLDAATQQAELIDLLDLLAGLGFNAVFFQVRPEGDALYRSDLEPWSRFLTGTQGADPGYDPLEVVVREGHARGLAVHAWFNPYRAKTTRKAVAVAPHLSVTSPELVRPYGALLWMDPGAPAVRERTVAVVSDVVRRYDVDGVHFDDYFYPYPNGEEFPDDATWTAYVAGGGTLSRGDWRRQNVDALVRDVSTAVRALKPWVRFGVSPFGIYRPGQPEGIRGLDQVDAIYADPLRWVDEDWVDYLAPQLYWPTTQEAQAHEPLLDWWATTVGDRARVYAGNYLSRVGATPAWSVDELRAQHDLARSNSGVDGNIWFSGRPLLEDREGCRSLFADLYRAPALPPSRAAAAGPVEPPSAEVDGPTLHLDHDAEDHLRSYVIYAQDETGWRTKAVVPSGTDGLVDVGPGRYAITAVDRAGVESPGVMIEVE